MAPSAGGSRSGGRPYALVWSPIPLFSWLMPFIGHIGVCSSSGCTYDFAGPYTVNEDALLFGRPTRYVTLAPYNMAVTKAPAPVPAAAAAGGDSGGDLEAAAAGASASARAVTAVASVCVPVGAGAGRYGDRSDGREAPAQDASVARYFDHRLASAAILYRLMRYDLMTSNCHCFVAHFLNQIAFRGRGWDVVNLAVFMFVHGRYTSLGGLLYTWLPWMVLVALGGYFGQMWFLYSYLLVCVPLLTWFVLFTKCCWSDLSP